MVKQSAHNFQNKMISPKYQNVKFNLLIKLFSSHHGKFFSDEKNSKKLASTDTNFIVLIMSANKYICLNYQWKCSTMLFELEYINCESDSTLLIRVQERCRNTDFWPLSA